ncbi:MAG: polyhydroxyalkanoic acid system family protein [Planctomycetota bacterium]
MPRYDLSVPHDLTKEDAKERVHSFADRLKEMMGDRVSDLESEWDQDTLRFGFATFGFRITGELEVKDSSVDVEGDLPFAAAMFKGKIVSGFQEQLEKILRGK